MKYDYFYYKNIFNKKKIIELNKFIENNFDRLEPSKSGAVGTNNEKKKYLSCKQILWFKVKNLLEDINQLAMNINIYNFGYNLYPINDRDYINYNIYSSDTKDTYDWHVDQEESYLIDCKLTLLINLSTEKYEGGKFKIFNQQEIIVNELDEPGNMLIFKSNINHKVTPVTKGKRKSLAIFYNGPLFK
jgi:PKHD-type hydroxylase